MKNDKTYDRRQFLEKAGHGILGLAALLSGCDGNARRPTPTDRQVDASSTDTRNTPDTRDTSDTINTSDIYETGRDTLDTTLDTIPETNEPIDATICGFGNTLCENQSQLYSSDVGDYEVTVEEIVFQPYAGGVSSAEFTINGERINLMEGESDYLADRSKLTLRLIREGQEGCLEAVFELNACDRHVLPYDTCSTKTLADYPSMFVDENGRFNGFIVVGENAQSIDNLAMTDIAANMRYQGEAVEFGDMAKLDIEIEDIYAQNLIVVGNSCSNSVTRALYNNPADCTWRLSPGEGTIKLFEHDNGNFALVVAGYTGADTRLAAKVLAHRSEFLCACEVEVSGIDYQSATISVTTSNPDLCPK